MGNDSKWEKTMVPQKTLPSPDCRLPRPHRGHSSWSGSSRGLPHSVQQLLQDRCIVLGLAFRRIQKSQALFLLGEFVEAAEPLLATRMRELHEIFLPESLPEAGPCVIPMAQFIRRSEIFQPLIDRRG